MTLQVAATQHHPTGAFFSLTESVRRSSALTRDPNLCQAKCFCHVRYHRPVPMLLPLPHPLQKHGPPPAPPGPLRPRGARHARSPAPLTCPPASRGHGAPSREPPRRDTACMAPCDGMGRAGRAAGARRGFSLLPPRLPPRTMSAPVPTVCSQVRRGDEGICSTQQTAKRSPGAKALGGFRGIALQHSRTE